QKKANAVDCEDHRTISLISHASKILLKVLTRRIEGKTNNFIGCHQFGFRRGCGTRDAVGVMRVLCERSLEFGNEVYICFVDFEKAFDRVDWIKMLEVMEEGVRVGGVLISDIRFADDQGMVASTEMGLMDKLNAIAKKYSMKINIKKTKTMVVSKKDGGTVSIVIDGQRVEQVKTFKYLGSVIAEDGRCMDDIKQRIGCAKDAFNKRKEL